MRDKYCKKSLSKMDRQKEKRSTEEDTTSSKEVQKPKQTIRSDKILKTASAANSSRLSTPSTEYRGLNSFSSRSSYYSSPMKQNINPLLASVRSEKILPVADSNNFDGASTRIKTIRSEKILPVFGKLSKHTSTVNVYYDEPQSPAKPFSPGSKYHLHTMSRERLYLRNNRTNEDYLVAERIKRTFVKNQDE